jgi:hypothetical protein
MFCPFHGSNVFLHGASGAGAVFDLDSGSSWLTLPVRDDEVNLY